MITSHIESLERRALLSAPLSGFVGPLQVEAPARVPLLMGPFQVAVTHKLEPEAIVQSQNPGDANSDGFVNILDYNILQANFGQTDATFEQADFNGDGFVGLTDFNILAAHFVDA